VKPKLTSVEFCKSIIDCALLDMYRRHCTVHVLLFDRLFCHWVLVEKTDSVALGEGKTTNDTKHYRTEPRLYRVVYSW